MKLYQLVLECLTLLNVARVQAQVKTCSKYNGISKGQDNSERLLYREGIIEEIPSSLCSDEPKGKNVILVIGDGMGWEMIRAGAIAKQVLAELEGLGVDTSIGAQTDVVKVSAKAAFSGRTLSDYYTSGEGIGLSWQGLGGYSLVTTSTVLLQQENDGGHYGPARSLLNGTVSEHDDGMATLAVDENGLPIDFDPRDNEDECGNMVLWNSIKGGDLPWDERYFQDSPDLSTGFDPEYIQRHATDSASTAGNLASGHKAAVNMMSVNLYEEKVSTIIEDAMMCGKSGGVVTSVPVLHATPAAFVTHSNYRKSGPQMQRTFRTINPTFASGVCTSRYQPSEKHKQSMIDGSLSSMWTFLYQNNETLAENFYDSIQNLDPDDDKHVLVCLGGDYSQSTQSNLPYRGVDSGFSNRWCSNGEVEMVNNTDGKEIPISVTPNSELCDHYTAEDIKQIPHISTNVEEALKFMGKDDEGFFLMYEQGDVDWAAHANHMDDMLGTMLDIDESVQKIIDWINLNGGYEKNALYVTADHDHYLTLSELFPEALANFIIDGKSHDITPENNSNRNPWSTAIEAGRHEDDSKSQTEHIKDFSTWTDEDIKNVAHFWGTKESGGNGWGSHSTKPVPISYQGDDGCLESLVGKGYQVVGKEVRGQPGMIDQVHIHACMMKNLFGIPTATSTRSPTSDPTNNPTLVPTNIPNFPTIKPTFSPTVKATPTKKEEKPKKNQDKKKKSKKDDGKKKKPKKKDDKKNKSNKKDNKKKGKQKGITTE